MTYLLIYAQTNKSGTRTEPVNLSNTHWVYKRTHLLCHKCQKYCIYNVLLLMLTIAK